MTNPLQTTAQKNRNPPPYTATTQEKENTIRLPSTSKKIASDIQSLVTDFFKKEDVVKFKPTKFSGHSYSLEIHCQDQETAKKCQGLLNFYRDVLHAPIQPKNFRQPLDTGSQQEDLGEGR